jgi:hypothetical protein
MKKRILIPLSFRPGAPRPCRALLRQGNGRGGETAKVREIRDEILAKLYKSNPRQSQIEGAAGYGTFNNKNMNLFLTELREMGKAWLSTTKRRKETFMAMVHWERSLGWTKDLSVVSFSRPTRV